MLCVLGAARVLVVAVLTSVFVDALGFSNGEDAARHLIAKEQARLARSHLAAAVIQRWSVTVCLGFGPGWVGRGSVCHALEP